MRNGIRGPRKKEMTHEHGAEAVLEATEQCMHSVVMVSCKQQFWSFKSGYRLTKSGLMPNRRSLPRCIKFQRASNCTENHWTASTSRREQSSRSVNLCFQAQRCGSPSLGQGTKGTIQAHPCLVPPFLACIAPYTIICGDRLPHHSINACGMHPGVASRRGIPGKYKHFPSFLHSKSLHG